MSINLADRVLVLGNIQFNLGNKVLQIAFLSGVGIFCPLKATACQVELNATMYEDAYDDIGADAVAEMQRYLDEWKKKYGRTSYLLTTKHAIRIPWEEMK